MGNRRDERAGPLRAERPAHPDGLCGERGGEIRPNAIGASDLVEGVAPAAPGEAGRTAKLRRVTAFAEIEATAGEVSELLVRSEEDRDTRLTMKYVIVELLRNVIQHSNDRLGGGGSGPTHGQQWTPNLSRSRWRTPAWASSTP